MNSSAIFGFAGVIVGAASTYVAQRGAEGRLAKADARVGVRLSHLDLVELRSTLHAALENDQLWEVGAVDAPRWKEHDAALARALPLEEWMPIEHAPGA